MKKSLMKIVVEHSLEELGIINDFVEEEKVFRGKIDFINVEIHITTDFSCRINYYYPDLSVPKSRVNDILRFITMITGLGENVYFKMGLLQDNTCIRGFTNVRGVVWRKKVSYRNLKEYFKEIFGITLNDVMQTHGYFKRIILHDEDLKKLAVEWMNRPYQCKSIFHTT